MVFNFNLDVARVLPVQNEVYDGSDASGWEVYAPVWAGTTGVRLKNTDTDSNDIRYFNAANVSPSPGSNPIGNGNIPSTWRKKSNSLVINFRLADTQPEYVNTGFITKNMMSLAGYSQLHVLATKATHSGVILDGNEYHYCKIGVTSNRTPRIGSNEDTTYPPPDPRGRCIDMQVGETVLDISDLNGEAYIYFAGANVSKANTTMDKIIDIEVTKVWLT